MPPCPPSPVQVVVPVTLQPFVVHSRGHFAVVKVLNAVPRGVPVEEGGGEGAAVIETNENWANTGTYCMARRKIRAISGVVW